MNIIFGIALAGFFIGESTMSWVYKPDHWLGNLIFILVGLALLTFWVAFFKKFNVNTMVAHKLELHKAGWAVFSRKS
jgi:putative Mn2+ efflux pump MntP